MVVNVPVFFTEPNHWVNVELRRYAKLYLKDEHGQSIHASENPDHKCPVNHWGYHNAIKYVDTRQASYGELATSKRGHYLRSVDRSEFPNDDPDWPTHCVCGYEFKPDDEWQVNVEAQYIRPGVDKSPIYTLRDAPVGMMWDAWWMFNERHTGHDGTALVIQVPKAHSFMPEQQASNCTMKDDNVHRCWVRHGDARKNEVHIDKNGVTCAAGAGSVVTSQWHGFIHHGFITDVPEDLAR